MNEAPLLSIDIQPFMIITGFEVFTLPVCSHDEWFQLSFSHVTDFQTYAEVGSVSGLTQ